ncbi:transcriptional regulator, XRE family [Methylorubrum populi BJ001]|jgi:transcriptional regulator with XRE-family HTH domain|uniref:Transcriptional regulator, XRE family n=1 Tax=Methylorubrum populi (strain ATCC BAA-705 / NCIMB 13946 / BJ001) TaxID=441620 RepID=B1ZD13_METPB|nr:helix-turn-helix transcriptional regulator [Methylorubrum populi]ACB80882.1 transcriptional regulator, XRE family [Methylorubrum populi BJ001]
MQIKSNKAATDIDVRIGQRIAALRVNRRMSQTELGTAIGVTFQQVQKYEKGRNRVGGGRLQQIATALGVRVSDFYGDEQPAGGDATVVFDLLRDPHGIRIARALQSANSAEARNAIVGVVEAVASSFARPVAA